MRWAFVMACIWVFFRIAFKFLPFFPRGSLLQFANLSCMQWQNGTWEGNNMTRPNCLEYLMWPRTWRWVHRTGWLTYYWGQLFLCNMDALRIICSNYLLDNLLEIGQNGKEQFEICEDFSFVPCFLCFIWLSKDKW